MKCVYVCSPMHGDIIRNRKRAKEYSKYVYKSGCIPIAVQFYLENATGLSEAKGDRKELLRLGKEMLNICDELWYFGDYISEGMKGEIELAKELGIKIRYVEKI